MQTDMKRTVYSFALFLCYSDLLGIQWGTDAIHCYVCNSHNDSRCAYDTPPEVLKKDCSDFKDGAKYTMCRKIKQVIEFSVNGLKPDDRVIRGCGWDESNYKGKCYQRSGFGGRQEVCSCLEDMCNGATPGSQLSPSIVAIVGCAMAAAVLLVGRN